MTADRDRYTDDSRDGSGRLQKSEVSVEVDFSAGNLADEAWYDASHGRDSVGTAADEADVTGPLHRARYRNRLGPNQGSG